MAKGVSKTARSEQAQHPGAMTRGQLRILLGVSEATIKRAIKDGRIPPPELHLSNGWRLWSDEQCKALLSQRITLGALR